MAVTLLSTYASSIALGALGLLGYLVYTVIYRLYLHPLAHIPGPKLAALTKAYETYYDIYNRGGGQFARKVRDLHQQYGPIVRITPGEVSINDLDFHVKLYAPQPHIRDRWAPITAILGTTGGTFSTIDHDLHRKRRVAASTFFSMANLHAADPVIRKHIGHCCDLMWKHKGETLEIRVPFAALMFDTMFDMAFNQQLNSLSDLDIAVQWDLTTEAVSMVAPWLKLFPDLFKPLLWLPLGIVRKLSRKLEKILLVTHRVKTQATKHLDLVTSDPQRYDPKKKPEVLTRPETLFDLLLRRGGFQNEEDLHRLTQEGTELFAASATPLKVLSAAMFHVHYRPQTLQALREELDAAFPDPMTVPSVKQVDELPYLNAVIKEALRIGYPVGGRLPQMAREDLVFNGYVLPAGTPLSVNHRTFMIDPEKYPEPDVFKPERWFTKQAQETEGREYIPYGRGGRMCLGNQFAQWQMMMVVATLCRRFEFELVDTTWERDVMITREPFLTHPTAGSRGVKMRILGMRK